MKLLFAFYAVLPLILMFGFVMFMIYKHYDDIRKQEERDKWAEKFYAEQRKKLHDDFQLINFAKYIKL